MTTRFCAVRFGNVLGSSGSVIPIFRRQIANGGPVTVTHPEMTRYFMTIPEAVQLVIQAGAMGGRGQIFVLDMGEPVRIVDLAEKMIRLSGKEPGRDIAIEFVGARPGEKLHEELVGDRRGRVADDHTRRSCSSSAAPIDPRWLEAELDELERLVDEGDTLEVVGTLARLVREPRAAAAVPVADAAEARPPRDRLAYGSGAFSSRSCPRSRSAPRARRCRAGVRSSQPCACTSTRNEPGPKIDDTSTMPLDSQRPWARRRAARRLVDLGDDLPSALPSRGRTARCGRSSRPRTAGCALCEPGSSWMKMLLRSSPCCPAGAAIRVVVADPSKFAFGRIDGSPGAGSTVRARA